MAVLNAVPDRAIHTAIEQYAYAHYEKGFPAECENWYWNKKKTNWYIVHNKKECT